MNGFGHTINSPAFDDWSDIESQRAAPRRPLSILAAGFVVLVLLALGALAGTQHAQWTVGSVELPTATAAVAKVQAPVMREVAVIATVAPGAANPSR